MFCGEFAAAISTTLASYLQRNFALVLHRCKNSLKCGKWRVRNAYCARDHYTRRCISDGILQFCLSQITLIPTFLPKSRQERIARVHQCCAQCTHRHRHSALCHTLKRRSITWSILAATPTSINSQTQKTEHTSRLLQYEQNWVLLQYVRSEQKCRYHKWQSMSKNISLYFFIYITLTATWVPFIVV